MRKDLPSIAFFIVCLGIFLSSTSLLVVYDLHRVKPKATYASSQQTAMIKVPIINAKKAPLPSMPLISTSAAQERIIRAMTKATPFPTLINHISPTSSAKAAFPTAASTPIPTIVPTSAQTRQTSPTTDVQTYILNGINEYRSSKRLSAVKTDSNTCGFANIRAQEITTAFNHDGFTNRGNSHTLPYPSYSVVTENIAMTSDYKQVVPMWIASPGHAENMQKDTPFVCVAQSGNYFAYEGWKP